MLNVICAGCHYSPHYNAEGCYAECRYAERHYAECRGAITNALALTQNRLLILNPLFIPVFPSLE
jgi:hypothetical protein